MENKRVLAVLALVASWVHPEAFAVVAESGVVADSLTFERSLDGSGVARSSATPDTLDVIIPATFATTCKCKANLTVSPGNGALLCPNGSVGLQILFTSINPTGGDCAFVNNVCAALENKVCTADIAPLDLTVHNCWSGGIHLTATGLQNGARFLFSNDTDDSQFDPNLSAPCNLQGGTATYEIKVFAGADVELYPEPLATFTFTLQCENCKTVP